MEFTCKKNKIHFEKWTCSTIFFSNYFTSKHKLKNNTSDPSFKKRDKKSYAVTGIFGHAFHRCKRFAGSPQPEGLVIAAL